MSLKRLILRSNGVLMGANENGLVVYNKNILENEIMELAKDGTVTPDTELFTPLLHEPILLKEWYDIEPTEQDSAEINNENKPTGI